MRKMQTTWQPLWQVVVPITNCVIVKVSPSASVSFANKLALEVTSTVKVVSSLVVFELSTAIGAWFTAVTVMVNVPISVRLPSVTV